MSIELIFLVAFSINLIGAEKWIKLPDIKPNGQIREIKHDMPKVVFKLAPPPAVISSDVMNTFFNHPSTTESPIITSSSTKRSYTKRYFQSTVTSKVITFPSNVSQLINDEEFLEEIPVVLVKPIKIQKVKFFNQTTAMNVVPIVKSTDNSNKIINGNFS